MAQPAKKKRGRPRKHPAPVSETATVIIPLVEIVKRKRGRPRKNVKPTAKPKEKKDYYTLKIEDVEYWAYLTDRVIFKRAAHEYKRMLKANISPEIRWHKGGIVVVANS